MQIKRKGKTGTYAIIGGLVGATTGAIIGFVDGDDEPGWFAMTAETKAATLAVPLFYIGCGIGALGGMEKANFKINGKAENILKYSEIFYKYSIVKKDSPSVN